MNRMFRALHSSYGSFVLLIAFCFLASLFGCQKKPGAQSRDESTPSTAQHKEPAISAAAKARKEAVSKLPAIASQPYTDTSRVDTGKNRFVDLPVSETGIDYVNKWTINEDSMAALGTSFIASGVAIGDYDSDGKPDVFVTGKENGGRLYRNLGGMKFRDVTQEVGIEPDGMWSSGVSFIDLNNDGRLDIYVCGYGCANRLYINQGERFQEQAAEYGLDYNGASVSAAFADYDLDGDIDVYLVTNRLDTTRQGKLPNEEITSRDAQGRVILNPKFREFFYLMPHPEKGMTHEPGGEFDHLFRNDGNKFTDVSKSAGIGELAYMGLSANWWDYNDDGLPDLYVANDFKGSDLLYQNQGKNSRGETVFRNVISKAMPHTPWFSMGSDISDINNDGKMDYLATDMAGSNHYRDKLSMGAMSGPGSNAWFLNWPNPPQYMRNSLYLNTGTDRFMEVAFLAGLAKTDWTWTVKFDDFDNDGLEDVYFTNGMSRDVFNGDYLDQMRNSNLSVSEQFDFWADKPRYELVNRAFKNNGDLEFQEVSQAWGLDLNGVSTGAATADLDGDGDLDIVVNGFDEPIRVYRNEIQSGNSIQFQLIGSDSNAQGIGARIDLVVRDAEPKQMRVLAAGRGFKSSSQVIAHFGTGDATEIEQVTIRWPSGVVQKFENLVCNHRHTIVEPSTSSNGNSQLTTNRPQPTLFATTDLLNEYQHVETSYDDFKREPLLPNKHSQLGPGMAWGDVNNDGLDDVYLGQAAGGPGRLMIRDGDSGFKLLPQPAFNQHSRCEDMGAAFFDADLDGDLDLYVASGGVEGDAGDEHFRDRLYLNDGTGVFADASDRIPDSKHSGSVVAPADFDRDGDIDLFVGSRLVVGAYPTTPDSMLLVNENGRFRDASEEFPGLKNIGMVTSAIWADANDDAWMDLVVSIDWGPTRLFLNDQGMLKDATENAGLAKDLGWHNSVSAGDVDNDGDLDFVVGNFGLNTKYSASKKKPELLFYGDFENNGKLQIVEAKYENGRCLPRRGLGCTSSAMPTIKEKLPTYHDFAISELVEIYSQTGLEDADRFEANNLNSGVWINQGNNADDNPVFSFSALPRIVQASPVFGSALQDFDGDGILDLVVAQNFHGPQPETGNMDGSVSLLLKGMGDGRFSPVWPNASGIMIDGDAAALTLADLNRDSRPDLVATVNNEPVQAFLSESDQNFSTVRLVSNSLSKNVIGCRVEFTMTDGSTRVRSITGGGSYLSQSGTDLYVAGSIKSATVRWPDGSSSEHLSPKKDNGVVQLKQPGQ